MPLAYYDHGRRDETKVALTFDDGPNPPRFAGSSKSGFLTCCSMDEGFQRDELYRARYRLCLAIARH